MSAPRERYASLSRGITSSSGSTRGPHSLISVYDPAVGTTTAVEGKGRAPVEAELAKEAGTRDGARGDERRARHEPLTREDLHFSEPLAAAHRQVGGRRRDDAFDEWPVDAHRTQDGLPRDERNRGPAVSGRNSHVHAPGRDHPCGALHRERPPQQRGEVRVAAATGRAAEDRCVDVQAVSPDLGDL